MSEEKKHRPMNEINEEYAQVCAKLGSAQYQKFRLERDIIMFNQTLDNLNSEAFSANQAAQAKKDEDASLESK